MVSRPVGVPNDASTFSCGHSSLQDLHLWQERGWEDLSGCTSGRHECSQHALWNERWVPDQHWQGRSGVPFKKWGQNLFLRYWDNDGVLAGETERRWESSFLLFAAVGLWRKCTAQIWPFPSGGLIFPAQKNNQNIQVLLVFILHSFVFQSCQEQVDAVLLLFSFTDKTSFDDLSNQITRWTGTSLVKVVVGTKYPHELFHRY